MLLSPPSILSRFPRFLIPRYSSMATASINDWRLETQGSVSYQVYTKPLVKSGQDERDYRLIQLKNGLQAILVHDAKADKAAASLDVAVGHLSDPDDMPGLAHFCEHLLFMGTERFPIENEYSEYLTQNNGNSNAYTGTTNTNYYFKVAKSALPGALERFAAFFHCPLFSPSCTSRELNAVDSENTKNHQDDMWRIFQLNKHLSQPGHVWSKFGSGNRNSLSKTARELKKQGKLVQNISPNLSIASTPLPSRSGSPAPSIASSMSTSSNSSETDADGGLVGRETRRRLVEWWSREYCASRMRLCIIGKESLDELANLAVTLFSPIPNRGRNLPTIGSHPFGDEQKGTLVFAQTVMAFHALEISFPLEDQSSLWKYKPIMLITHFVGHEGPGSLHSYLKRKHWVTSVASGPQDLARGIAMFKITIQLTPEGFANYRSVVLAAYKYLSLLRSSKFDPFHHEELVQLTQTKFRFLDKKQPDDYSSWLTKLMTRPVPHHLLLAAPALISPWENEEDKKQGEEKIAEYLESFRVGNGRVVLMAKKEDTVKLHADLQWDKEPWYGTEYAVQRWDADFIKEADGVNDISEFFLPGPNKFIPSRLEVEKKDIIKPQKRPHLIRQTPLSTLWHKKDDKFWAPKAHVFIDFRSPVVNASARTAVLTRLYADLVTDSLTEFSYDADLAGLRYSFLPHTTGLYAAMNGYNDKMFLLVDTLLDKIKTLVVDPRLLEVKKESIRREYLNFFLRQSYNLSDYYARYLLSETHWTIEEKLTELPTITVDEVQAHFKYLLSQVNLRILVVGNMYKDEAIKIAETAERGLGQSESSDGLSERALLLPQGSNFVLRSPLPNPNEANSALSYFAYYGPVSDQKSRVTSTLLTQILTEPSFNVLRTREQLGYVVQSTNWTLPGLSERGLRIVIQSEKKPGYLEARVEAFLDEMKGKLETMSEAEFILHRSALEKKWQEADKNLSDEAARYLVQLQSGHWDFLRNEKDAELIRTITKSDVVNLFMTKVHPSSQTRSKLSVQMLSQKPRPKRVSPAAVEAFEILLRQSFPDIDGKAWRDSVEEEIPSLMEFGQYWLKVLNTEEGKKLLARLPAILNEYPVAGEDDDHKRTEVTYIEDRKAFKAGLLPAVDPGPLEQWNDLPQPRI